MTSTQPDTYILPKCTSAEELYREEVEGTMACYLIPSQSVDEIPVDGRVTVDRGVVWISSILLCEHIAELLQPVHKSINSFEAGLAKPYNCAELQVRNFLSLYNLAEEGLLRVLQLSSFPREVKWR